MLRVGMVQLWEKCALVLWTVVYWQTAAPYYFTQSALTDPGRGGAHVYILWLKKHPGFIEPGGHRTDTSLRRLQMREPPTWVNPPVVLGAETELSGFKKKKKKNSWWYISESWVPARTDFGFKRLLQEPRYGYCWIRESGVCIFPLDTCSVDARSRSCQRRILV